MTNRLVKASILLILMGVSGAVVSAQRGQPGASCDKACLQGIADTYLAALVAHDPSKAPMAPDAKFTEQAQPMAIGEGQLWKLTTGGPTTFKIPVADPVAGQIGLIVMLKAALPPEPPRGGGAGPAASPATPTGPANVQLALRLKVQGRQITEAEHVFAHQRAGAGRRIGNAASGVPGHGAPGRAHAAELDVPARQLLQEPRVTAGRRIRDREGGPGGERSAPRNEESTA